MSEVAVSTLSREEARSLTDEVKGDAERLWSKLLELYEGGAHVALGYSSWGDYFEKEFGGSGRRGYELLKAGRVLQVVRNSALTPANEAQANELTPLLDQPDELRDAWTEASANGQPTAKEVRDVVQKFSPEVKQEVIRRCRAGERQVAVAENLGISQSAVSLWIRQAKAPTEKKETRRRKAGTPTSRIMQELQKVLRRWETLTPDEWVNVSEAARRARVLGDAIAFLETHRAEYASQGHKLLVKGGN